jgi:hypothetical protein
MEVVSFTPRPRYLQEKSPRYPLDRRLGGPQSRSGRGVEGQENNSLPFHSTWRQGQSLSPLCRVHFFMQLSEYVQSKFSRKYKRNTVPREMFPRNSWELKLNLVLILIIKDSFTRTEVGTGVWFQAGVEREFFCISPHVQTSSGDHTASYQLGTGGAFPGGKAAGTWSW